MLLTTLTHWTPRLTAFAVAAALAASWTYGVLHWPGSAANGAADAATAAVSVAATAADASTTRNADPQLLTRLLGGSAALSNEPAAASLASRFVLSGVVAGTSGRGAALIAVDGKPLRSYPVGSRVTESLVLQAVAPRRAMLAARVDAPVEVTLEMKAPGK